MIEEQEGLVLAELAVANEFVLLTDKSLSLSKMMATRRCCRKPDKQLSHLSGDSSLAWKLPKLKISRGVTRRPRVLCSGVFIGFRQNTSAHS